MRRRPIVSMALGRKALTALGAAAGDHSAATHSRHAGAEAVAACADEFARLIGAFHVTNSTYSKKENTPPQSGSVRFD